MSHAGDAVLVYSPSQAPARRVLLFLSSRFIKSLPNVERISDANPVEVLDQSSGIRRLLLNQENAVSEGFRSSLMQLASI